MFGDISSRYIDLLTPKFDQKIANVLLIFDNGGCHGRVSKLPAFYTVYLPLLNNERCLYHISGHGTLPETHHRNNEKTSTITDGYDYESQNVESILQSA